MLPLVGSWTAALGGSWMGTKPVTSSQAIAFLTYVPLTARLAAGTVEGGWQPHGSGGGGLGGVTQAFWCPSFPIDLSSITSILQMSLFGPRKVKPFVQGHTASKQHAELRMFDSRMGSFLEPPMPLPASGAQGASHTGWVGQDSHLFNTHSLPRHAEA